MAREIPKAYQPQEIEPKWAEFWVAEALFRADADAPPPVFSIVIPPPNVTGFTAHRPHAGPHGNRHHDPLAPHARRQHLVSAGDGPRGNFNAAGGGAATGGARRSITATLGREEFENRVWKWKEESGGKITEQMRQIGESCDWSREKFTLSPEMSRVVREAFVRLYEEKLIYRAHYLTNWCPVCLTVLSDLEVVHEERLGHLWYIKYPVADAGGAPSGSERFVVVATTRPETMLGDTAVAVHPEDERYKDLIGKSVALPLTNRVIPIIADESVDREFGTGAVKITPAHDPNDFEMGRRHHLPEINVMADDGKMNSAAGVYAGMDRFVARKKIVEDLKAQGLLEKVDRPYARGGIVRTQPDGGGAARVDAVVLQNEAAGRPGDCGGGARRDSHRAGQPAGRIFQLDAQYSRLDAVAATVVGPPDSGVVLRGIGARDGGARDAGEVRDVRIGKFEAGSGCAGHLVQLGAVAVFDAGMAGRRRRISRLIIRRRC